MKLLPYFLSFHFAISIIEQFYKTSLSFSVSLTDTFSNLELYTEGHIGGIVNCLYGLVPWILERTKCTA